MLLIAHEQEIIINATDQRSDIIKTHAAVAAAQAFPMAALDVENLQPLAAAKDNAKPRQRTDRHRRGLIGNQSIQRREFHKGIVLDVPRHDAPLGGCPQSIFVNGQIVDFVGIRVGLPT